MAVQKTIQYRDSDGNIQTTTATFDLQKIAVDPQTNEEKVILVGWAPGMTPDQYWRKDIDGLIDDALSAAANTNDSSPFGTKSRFTHNASAAYSGYGDVIQAGGLVPPSGTWTSSGTPPVVGVPGIRKQLLDLS